MMISKFPPFTQSHSTVKKTASAHPFTPTSFTMTAQKHKLDVLQIRFARLAWLSLCLTIVTGAAHVRAFPSYNAAAALVAIYSSQEKTNIDILVKNYTLFAIIGGLTSLADFAFCIIWAGEIAQGYSGLMKLSLVAFISNILVKGALLYSAMTIWVAASSTNSDEDDGNNSRGEKEMISPSKRKPPLNNSFELAASPVRAHHNLTPGVGIPGLVSPGFDPRNRV